MKNDDIHMKELQIYNLCAVIVNCEHPCPTQKQKLFFAIVKKMPRHEQLESYEHGILMSIQTAITIEIKTGIFSSFCFVFTKSKFNESYIKYN